ncbi:MAG: 6-carboxytetrahydropterin synthase QueD [Spirochaetaceae bacterium]|nr:6-carboxytetrahydropterin synthase QueD [Spirochaetaceae bacterium]
MYEVRVEADFAAAHFLKDYHGKCEALHGHNYKVYAHVKGSKLDKGGMLLDFTILKKSLKDVCNQLDHTNLNDLTDYNNQEVFNQNPSAERIAQWIFQQLEAILKEKKALNKNTKLYAVDVFETDTSRARYIAD